MECYSISVMYLLRNLEICCRIVFEKEFYDSFAYCSIKTLEAFWVRRTAYKDNNVDDRVVGINSNGRERMDVRREKGS